MSLSSHINEKANLIWAIADKLTGVYKPHEYGEVILPLTVIRRFDCILSDTKDAVLEKYEQVKDLPMRDIRSVMYLDTSFTIQANIPLSVCWMIPIILRRTSVTISTGFRPMLLKS